MKETYSTLLQTAQDLVIDDKSTTQTSLSAPSAFLARENNNTIQYLFQQLRNYKTIPTPKTMSTVEDQIYYHYPPGLLNLESIAMTIGDINYPLKPINSQATWDHFQQLDITSSGVPQYYFPRQYDFGIYPTPAEDDLTVTLTGSYLPRRLSIADYDTGTVVVTQNSQTVTGTDTTFTAAMVGRWFCEADSNGLTTGNWYKIGAFTSSTVITLQSYFEETSLSGATYIIGQSPEIPEELHQYIPYRSAANYLATTRRNPTKAQTLLNYFYTGDYSNNNRGGGIKGGILGIINRYNNTGRSNSQLVRLNKKNYNHWRDERWAITLS